MSSNISRAILLYQSMCVSMCRCVRVHACVRVWACAHNRAFPLCFTFLTFADLSCHGCEWLIAYLLIEEPIHRSRAWGKWLTKSLGLVSTIIQWGLSVSTIPYRAEYNVKYSLSKSPVRSLNSSKSCHQYKTFILQSNLLDGAAHIYLAWH